MERIKKKVAEGGRVEEPSRSHVFLEKSILKERLSVAQKVCKMVPFLTLPPLLP